MATLLKFKQGDSGTELNLNTGSTGFTLEENGWNLAVATPVHMGDPAPVLERLDLLLSNTNYNNLASDMQSLHEMQVIADRYINDPTQEDPVWLHAKMDGETGERRALVRSITMQYKAPWFGAGQSTTNIPLVLMVVRGPYWESTSVRNLPDGAPSAAACVVYDYTAAGDAVGAHDIVGDVGARIRFFETLSNNVSLDTIWMGIRSAGKHGDFGDFIPIWELEYGSFYTDVATDTDSTASGGDRVTITKSGVDWDDGDFHNVMEIDLDNVTANPEDQFGNYLWLLRATTNAASSTWEIRLEFRSGAYDPSIFTDIVEIDSNQNYQFYEMGIIPIPLHGLQVIINADFPKANIDEYRIRLIARRTNGASDLHLDCLIPLTIDEGFCKISNITYSGVLTNMLAISPHGIAQFYRRTSAGELAGIGTIDSINNFVLPLGDGRIYCVAANQLSSDITDTITFNDGDTGRYYERWLSLRGSE